MFGETVPFSALSKSVLLVCKRKGLFAVMCNCAEMTVVETETWFGDDIAMVNSSGIDVLAVEI